MAELIHTLIGFPRRPITYVSPQVSVQDCINKMVTEDIGALVIHDGENLIGIVSERDIVRSAIHRNFDPSTTTAGEIAYKDVSILTMSDTVEKAMETITLTKRRHVLVADQDTIVAILSIGDVLVHTLEDKARVIEHLENYIHHA